jgi:predicted DNA-binding transcriptional regulator AlpA
MSLLLSIKDICRELGICRRTLDRMRKASVFPAPFTLRPLRWTRQQLSKFLSNE